MNLPISKRGRVSTQKNLCGVSIISTIRCNLTCARRLREDEDGEVHSNNNKNRSYFTMLWPNTTCYAYEISMVPNLKHLSRISTKITLETITLARLIIHASSVNSFLSPNFKILHGVPKLLIKTLYPTVSTDLFALSVDCAVCKCFYEIMIKECVSLSSLATSFPILFYSNQISVTIMLLFAVFCLLIVLCWLSMAHNALSVYAQSLSY